MPDKFQKKGRILFQNLIFVDVVHVLHREKETKGNSFDILYLISNAHMVFRDVSPCLLKILSTQKL